MRTLVWLFLAVGVICLLAPAAEFTPSPRAETLGMYADPLGIDCAIFDPGPTVFEVFFVHTTAGAEAITFGAPLPSCLTATYLAINGNCGILGCSIDHMAISYGQCLSGAVAVASFLFLGSFAQPPCCYYWPMASNLVPSGQIEAVDCSGNVFAVTSQPGIFNQDASCPCGATVGTERKSWGGIKSLYVDE